MSVSPPSALALLSLRREEGSLWGVSVKSHDRSGSSTGWDTPWISGYLSIIPRHPLVAFPSSPEGHQGPAKPLCPLPRTRCVPPRLSVLASMEAAGFSVGSAAHLPTRLLQKKPFSLPDSLPKPPSPDI